MSTLLDEVTLSQSVISGELRHVRKLLVGRQAHIVRKFGQPWREPNNRTYTITFVNFIDNELSIRLGAGGDSYRLSSLELVED